MRSGKAVRWDEHLEDENLQIFIAMSKLCCTEKRFSRLNLDKASCYFNPTFFDNMHSEAGLMQFAKQHIEGWTDTTVTALLSCGRGLPTLLVYANFFLPRGNELLEHRHYHDSDIIVAKSLPLGMKSVAFHYRSCCYNLINQFLDNHTDEFRTNRFGKGNFQERLFHLMTDVKVSHPLIKDTFRLIAVTYIIGRAITLDKVSGPFESEPFDIPKSSKNFGAARLVSRQIKHVFYGLQKDILDRTTTRLAKALTSPKSCEDFLAVFISVIGLCMACEDQQKTYHVTSENNVKIIGRKASIAQANSGCEGIEGLVTLVMQIFFHRVPNLRNLLLSDPQHHASVEFFDAIRSLVEKNYALLVSRKKMDVSDISYRNFDDNTSRLVARFLLPVFDSGDNLGYDDDVDRDYMEMAPIAYLRERAWWTEE